MPTSKTALGAARVVALVTALAVPVAAPVPATAELVPSFSGVVKATKPAVVTVRIALPPGSARMVRAAPEDSDSGIGDFFERFFGGDAPSGHTPDGPVPPGVMPPGYQPVPEALGSGFIVDPSGVIVTNYHVVEDSDDITVELTDGTELQATVIGADEKTDIAVLRVDAGRALPSVDWGNSDAVEVGDWAIAIGNPFGLGASVSAGIISARGRNIHSGPYDDYFQIDAPINRGNSGGPLFNQRGQVIGVNAAIFSPSGGSIGIGFAIPSNQAREIVAELRAFGFVQRGWIGISIQQITPPVAEALDLARTEGVLVVDVNEASPAEAAGLAAGDIVIGFDGAPVETMRDLTRAVADTAPGERTTIRVLRDGSERALTVVTAPYPR